MALFIKKNGSLQQVAIGHEISKPEQQKNVSLDLASGDQVVTPDNGQVLTQVLIKKPVTLLPENIKDGVNIGGIIGTYTGSADYLKNRINGVTDNYSFTNSDITSLQQYGFYYDKNLISISLPNVTNLAYNVFAYCANLTTVSLPSITNLTGGSNAFSQCTSLSNVSMPNLNTVSNVDSTFSYCKNLKNIDLTNLTMLSNANNMFKSSGLLSINLPSLTYTSSSELFRYCNKLTTANLPSLSSTTSNGTFRECPSLTTVNLGKATSIGQYCFDGCTSLTDITLSKTGTVCNLLYTSAIPAGQSITIHVPSDLITSYQTATNWSILYNNGDVTFVAIQ